MTNHQHRQPPGDAYERREFVDSRDDVVVVTAMQLLDWWRQGQWSEIRAVFGTAAGEQALAAGAPLRTEPTGGSRPWWRRQR
ncbi:hypothetical protein LFM56_00180 [Cellulomonas iranensis]|uniref:hypothetical protein n=1 Tax=Cellulomonas iranensis TaxID=76862 RepID=UPI001CF3A5E5|nr:hypothetical protein [Cellulomonas iranensis]UCN14786.1 hypothetical protein LFM56_00180 [Cellulomonas iranensis]